MEQRREVRVDDGLRRAVQHNVVDQHGEVGGPAGHAVEARAEHGEREVDRLIGELRTQSLVATRQLALVDDEVGGRVHTEHRRREHRAKHRVHLREPVERGRRPRHPVIGLELVGVQHGVST